MINTCGRIFLQLTVSIPADVALVNFKKGNFIENEFSVSIFPNIFYGRRDNLLDTVNFHELYLV